MVRGIVGVVMVAALAGGCAVGQQITYTSQVPRIRSPGPVKVAVAVQDARQEVRFGTKSPNFCGMFRGGFGNPFDVTTASNRPLATDFADVIGRGLAAAGMYVAPVPAAPNQQDAETVRGLASQGADRALLIQIAQWKSDTYQNTSLEYFVTARVLDAQGRLLGEDQITGKDSLGGAWNPGAHAKEVVPLAYREGLERLLNSPRIQLALAAVASAPQSSPPPQIPASPQAAPPSTAPPPTAPPPSPAPRP